MHYITIYNHTILQNVDLETSLQVHQFTLTFGNGTNLSFITLPSVDLGSACLKYIVPPSVPTPPPTHTHVFAITGLRYCEDWDKPELCLWEDGLKLQSVCVHSLAKLQCQSYFGNRLTFSIL